MVSRPLVGHPVSPDRFTNIVLSDTGEDRVPSSPNRGSDTRPGSCRSWPRSGAWLCCTSSSSGR